MCHSEERVWFTRLLKHVMENLKEKDYSIDNCVLLINMISVIFLLMFANYEFCKPYPT